MKSLRPILPILALLAVVPAPAQEATSSRPQGAGRIAKRRRSGDYCSPGRLGSQETSPSSHGEAASVVVGSGMASLCGEPGN